MEDPGSGDPANEDDDVIGHVDDNSDGRDLHEGAPDTPGEPSDSDTAGTDGPEHPDGRNEFDETFVFDDEFVRAAEVKEPTAAERQRAVRQANLQRLLQDEDAQQENLLNKHRRLAPLSDNFDDPSAYDERPYDYDDEYFDYSDSEFGHDDFNPYMDPADHDLWVSQRRRRRNRRVLMMVSVIVIISVVFVYALAQFFAGLSIRNANSASRSRNAAVEQSGTGAGTGTPVAGARQPGDPQNAEAGSSTRPGDWPPTGKWPVTPLGVPAAVPAGGGPHSYLMLQADGSTPVAYDPCRAIHYVTHGAATAPPGAERLTAEALKTVSSLTGLVFIDDGQTDEAPSDDRPAYQPDNYGKRWAPVLISWSTATESPRLGVTAEDGAPPGSTVDVLGYAGSVSAGFTNDGGTRVEAKEPKGLTIGPVVGEQPLETRHTRANQNAITERTDGAGSGSGSVSEERIYVTGSIVLDRDNFAQMLGESDGYARARATVLHELGHLVGLNHVDDPSQLMAPTLNGSPTEFASGDKQGLAALGRGACMPTI